MGKSIPRDYERAVSRPPIKRACRCAIGELAVISAELRDLSPDHVIWDIEDLSKQPPWGNDISEDITDLSNYFVTSDGEDFLTILLHALEKAKDVNEDVNIESM